MKKRGGWHISSASAWTRTTRTASSDVFMDPRPNWASCHLRSSPEPEEGTRVRRRKARGMEPTVRCVARSGHQGVVSFSLLAFTPAFECPLTSVLTMSTAFAPSYRNAAKDGSTHSAASHPLTASAWATAAEYADTGEAAGGGGGGGGGGCARWLKPLWSADMWIVFHWTVSAGRCLCPLDEDWWAKLHVVWCQFKQRTGSTRPFPSAPFDLFDLFISTSFTFSRFNINLSVVRNVPDPPNYLLKCWKADVFSFFLSEINHLSQLDCVFIHHWIIKRLNQ